MVASCQGPYSSVVPATSNHGNFRRNFNASSASSSGPHSCSDLFPSISFSNCEQKWHSQGVKILFTCGYRRSHNLKSGLPDKCRSLGAARAVKAYNHQGRTIGHGLRSSSYPIELSSSSRDDYYATRHHYSCFRCSISDESAASESASENSLELPLFPLPLVLFPGAILPLQIFEYRYRIMMHTLLQTDLRFGVVYTDKTSGLAGVGCVGEVVKHERLVDDRFFMICKGQERFRVVDIVRTKPYLVARVEWLEDRPSDKQEDVEALANEVETYMKDVIRLSNRVNGKPEKAAPEDLRKKLFPTPFSFWVGSTFEGAPVEQQALLELEDTAQRLKREKETLRNTLNYLSAASAVKDAFPSAE